MPAYPDDRDGTGIIYEWLQRGRSSDSDNDGVARESGNNPNGYGDPADGAAGVPGRRGKPGVGGRLAGVLFLLAFTARVVRPPAAETAPSPDPAGAASVGR